MPLTQFLEQESARFDPPTVKLMTHAYFMPMDDGVTRLVVKMIIEGRGRVNAIPSARYAAACRRNCAAGVDGLRTSRRKATLEPDAGHAS